MNDEPHRIVAKIQHFYYIMIDVSEKQKIHEKSV